MNKSLISTFLMLLMAVVSLLSNGNESISAKQTIDEFYKSYLNYNYQKTPNIPKPQLAFSKAFAEAIVRNENVCKNYATGICGWDADSDKYLNTQEADPLLNYGNSKIKYREITSSEIEVRFNVYPSEKKEVEYYDRVVTFIMIRENDNWVADDIVYGEGVSARESIETENANYIAHPDPDSKVMKAKK